MSAGLPFMITQRQRQQLRTLGHSDSDIDRLTPEQAHQILSVQPVAAAQTGVPATAHAFREERIAFENCRRTVLSWWPAYWPFIEAVLSLTATLKLKDIPASIALFAMAPSGIGKNTVFKMFGWDLERLIVWRDQFTNAAIQSHWGDEKDPRKLSERALFRKAKHSLLITPELAPMFRGRPDVLRERFAHLAQMLDGEGRITDSGTHGALGEKGDFTGVWTGGTTPFYMDMWETMSTLGTRLLFFWLLKSPYVADEDYAEALRECKAAINSFLEALVPEGSVRTVELPRMEDSVKDAVRRYAALLALGHGVRKTLSGEAETLFPSPNHFRSRLGHIVRGRALVHGRTQVLDEDLQMARWITLSSMPLKRGPVLVELSEGKQQAGEIAEACGLSVNTVLNTLRELVRLEIVEELGLAPPDAAGRPPMRYGINMGRLDSCM